MRSAIANLKMTISVKQTVYPMTDVSLTLVDAQHGPSPPPKPIATFLLIAVAQRIVVSYFILTLKYPFRSCSHATGASRETVQPSHHSRCTTTSDKQNTFATWPRVLNLIRPDHQITRAANTPPHRNVGLWVSRFNHPIDRRCKRRTTVNPHSQRGHIEVKESRLGPTRSHPGKQFVGVVGQVPGVVADAGVLGVERAWR